MYLKKRTGKYKYRNYPSDDKFNGNLEFSFSQQNKYKQSNLYLLHLHYDIKITSYNNL
jgi:hypothetical protein